MEKPPSDLHDIIEAMILPADVALRRALIQRGCSLCPSHQAMFAVRGP
jgi:hypothetical protein